ncbi:MAG: cytidine deaminase [Bacilli bacterium]|jgi:cytidine deaminase|nr:cytidine deaminase [Acholeplasmataceae bacterium]
MEKKYQLVRKYYDNAFAIYSKFKVGALLVLKDGSFIGGSNIENASYGLTNCAERSALFAAYSEGYRKDDILELIVLTNTKVPSSPCGACRQVVVELMNQDATVTMINLEGNKVQMKVKELLPGAFTERNLTDEAKL